MTTSARLTRPRRGRGGSPGTLAVGCYAEDFVDVLLSEGAVGLVGSDDQTDHQVHFVGEIVVVQGHVQRGSLRNPLPWHLWLWEARQPRPCSLLDEVRTAVGELVDAVDEHTNNRGAV